MNNQQRTHEIESLAQQNKWNFTSNANYSAIPALQKFEFQTGEQREVGKIENLIEGENFKVFDVYWKKKFDPSDALAAINFKDSSVRNIQQQTMFLFESADLQLAKFYVYPTNSNNWLNNWLDKTFLQSNFSAYPEFEKRWAVRGAIKELFDETVINFYETVEEFWTFATGNYIFIYQPNILTEPTQISDWVHKLKTLSQLFSQK